jgi:hypothetical protein
VTALMHEPLKMTPGGHSYSEYHLREYDWTELRSLPGAMEVIEGARAGLAGRLENSSLKAQ